MPIKSLKLLIFILTITTTLSSYAQLLSSEQGLPRYPGFLEIAPDAKSTAMGFTGAASEPDAHSIYWNGAKTAFISDSSGFGVTLGHLPYFGALVDDMHLNHLSLYKTFNTKSALSFSWRTFSFGNFTLRDNNGRVISNISPRESAFDLGYSRRLGNHLSLGITGRILRTYKVDDDTYSLSFCGDLSLFRKSDLFNIGQKESTFSYGISLNNLGSKIEILENTKTFMPANLRVGSALAIKLNDKRSLAFTVDASKLMVPSQAIYLNDEIISGKDSEGISALQGMLQSFSDAAGVVSINPVTSEATVEDGSRLKEELREVFLSVGGEFQVIEYVALRAGYFHQNETKGHGSIVTTGLGLNYKVVSLDLAYLFPTDSQNPLSNTLFATLSVDIHKNK